MTDRRNRTENPWRDHPLRETFLAQLPNEAGAVLIPAAEYLESALLEAILGGPGPGEYHRRMAVGLMLDARYAAREARGLLDDWGGTDPLRRAVVEALDGLEAAQSALAATLDGILGEAADLEADG